MNDNDTLSAFGEALILMIRKAVRDEIDSLMPKSMDERLLDIVEAAKLLSISEDWLYRHAKNLPFTRKLGAKMLRFSYQGIQKYLASRQRT